MRKEQNIDIIPETEKAISKRDMDMRLALPESGMVRKA